MNSVPGIFKAGFLLVAFILVGSYCATLSAQSTTLTTLKSRVSVVTNQSNTNIWVSDFPKKTSVVICDTDHNLLSIVSTNDFGSAYVTLPTNIKTTVIVKTLDGEIVVSNKAILKNNEEEQTALSAKIENPTKA